MKCIHKYPLMLMGSQDVALPQGAVILTAQMEDVHLYVFAVADPLAPVVHRRIVIRSTGDLVDDDLTHIATVQTHDGQVVRHVFEQVGVWDFEKMGSG